MISIDRSRQKRIQEFLRRGMAPIALAAMVVFAGVTWMSPRIAVAAPKSLPGVIDAGDSTDSVDPPSGKKVVAGKINLNTATPEQLVLLPGVGPSKAERVVAWRGKYGPFKRVADLRKVKGFGYKTLKRLEPLLDVKGDTTLALQ